MIYSFKKEKLQLSADSVKLDLAHFDRDKYFPHNISATLDKFTNLMKLKRCWLRPDSQGVVDQRADHFP